MMRLAPEKGWIGGNGLIGKNETGLQYSVNNKTGLLKLSLGLREILQEFHFLVNPLESHYLPTSLIV
jgi:hypothetical protein